MNFHEVFWPVSINLPLIISSMPAYFGNTKRPSRLVNELISQVDTNRKLNVKEESTEGGDNRKVITKSGCLKIY